jgi:sterol desaturase/sphingolipid hydroxylase (fatty acid hydroxylase superfamily)
MEGVNADAPIDTTMVAPQLPQDESIEWVLKTEQFAEVPSAPKLPPVGGWKKAIFLRLLAVIIIGSGLFISREGATIVIFLFIIVVPFERLFPRQKHQGFKRPHLDLDIGYAMAAPFLNIVALTVGIFIGVVSLAWIPGLLIAPYVAMIPSPYKLIAGILLFDMTTYWAHRFYHEVPVLWKFHSIHHSTEHMDWVSGFRAHPFDGTLIVPAVVFLIAAGFETEQVGFLAVFQIVFGLFLHANVRFRFKIFDRFIMTPEFHHWHHSNEEDAIWSNYSTFLPLWDMLFGTYFMPKGKRRPKIYGVDELVPMTMAEQLKYPFEGVENPFTFLRHPLRALWYPIRHPLRSIGRSLRFSGRMIKGYLGIAKLMFRSATRPWGEKFPNAARHIDRPAGYSRKNKVTADLIEPAEI